MLRVGTIAGVIMLIPFFIFSLFFMMFLLGGGPDGAPMAFDLFQFLILLLGVMYTAELSAVSGYLGVCIRHEL